jgi:hypothetical protein
MALVSRKMCSALTVATLVGSTILSSSDVALAQSVNSKLNRLSARIGKLEADIKKIPGTTNGPGQNGARGEKGERGATGPQGPAGAKGLKGDKGEKGQDGASIDPAQLQTKIVNTIFDAQDLPIKNVLYQYDAVQFADGAQKFVALGSYKLGADGKVLHRVVVRKGATGDTSPFLENSPTLFDSGIKSDAEMKTSRFYQKTGPVDTIVWLTPGTGRHKFPMLRAVVGNAQTRTMTNCGQGVIDAPFTDNVNSQVPAVGGACSFGSRITYAVASFANLGISLGTGVRISADPSTVAKVCQVNGFEGASVVNAKAFASCSNNTIVKWSGTAWQVLNACSSNSGLDAGDLTCYKLGL